MDETPEARLTRAIVEQILGEGGAVETALWEQPSGEGTVWMIGTMDEDGHGMMVTVMVSPEAER